MVKTQPFKKFSCKSLCMINSFYDLVGIGEISSIINSTGGYIDRCNGTILSWHFLASPATSEYRTNRQNYAHIDWKCTLDPILHFLHRKRGHICDCRNQGKANTSFGVPCVVIHQFLYQLHLSNPWIRQNCRLSRCWRWFWNNYEFHKSVPKP